jgi:hypothetical protein
MPAGQSEGRNLHLCRSIHGEVISILPLSRMEVKVKIISSRGDLQSNVGFQLW